MKDKSNNKKNRVVVKNYPYSETAKEIFNLLKDGNYHSTKNKADQMPFKYLLDIRPEETRDLLNADGEPDQKAINRYVFKKRRILLDQFTALKLLGFAGMKSKTSSATYALNKTGLNMLKGLAIMDEAQKRGLKFENLWKLLFKSQPPEFD